MFGQLVVNMNSDGDILEAFNPLYIFNKCFLMYPFHLCKENDSVNLRIYKRDIIIILLQVLFILPAAYIPPISINYLLGITFTDLIVLFFEELFRIINSFATIQFFLTNKAKASNIINEVYAVDKLFKKLDIKKNYKIIKHFCYALILQMLCLILLNLIKEFANRGGIDFMHFVDAIFSALFVAAPKCFVYFFIYDSIHSFIVLNKRIKHIVKEHTIIR